MEFHHEMGFASNDFVFSNERRILERPITARPSVSRAFVNRPCRRCHKKSWQQVFERFRHRELEKLGIYASSGRLVGELQIRPISAWRTGRLQHFHRVAFECCKGRLPFRERAEELLALRG
jgi:hypothetical protein